MLCCCTQSDDLDYCSIGYSGARITGTTQEILACNGQPQWWSPGILMQLPAGSMVPWFHGVSINCVDPNAVPFTPYFYTILHNIYCKMLCFANAVLIPQQHIHLLHTLTQNQCSMMLLFFCLVECTSDTQGAIDRSWQISHQERHNEGKSMRCTACPLDRGQLL